MLDVIEKTNIHKLNRLEKQSLYKEIYHAKGVFKDIFNTSSDYCNFECANYSEALRDAIQQLLIEKNVVSDIVPLEYLHEHIDNEMKAYNFNDGVNKISSFFYETNTKFMRIYHEFVKNFLTGLVTDDFYFQATPTIRLHCPNAENSKHYPRYHTDIGYGHPPEEINIWLPLTKINDSHGFKMMNLMKSNNLLQTFDYNFDDFINSAVHNSDFNTSCSELSEDVTTPFGKVLFFDSRCIHSGEPMQEFTRVSIDIRIIRVKDYERSNIEYQGAGRRKILFIPGECYNQHSINNFKAN